MRERPAQELLASVRAASASMEAEGACKSLIDLHFGRSSTRWSRAGAEPVLHLRPDHPNHR